MFQKDVEPRRLEFYQGLVPLHSSAEPYLLVSSPHPPLSRSYLSPTLYHHLSLFICNHRIWISGDKNYYQVATSVAAVAVMYMRIFLPDSIVDDNVSAPLLSDEKLKVSNSDENSNAEMQSSKALPSIPDLIALLKTRSVNFPALNSQHRYSLLWMPEIQLVSHS